MSGQPSSSRSRSRSSRPSTAKLQRVIAKGASARKPMKTMCGPFPGRCHRHSTWNGSKINKNAYHVLYDEANGTVTFTTDFYNDDDVLPGRKRQRRNHPSASAMSTIDSGCSESTDGSECESGAENKETTAKANVTAKPKTDEHVDENDLDINLMPRRILNPDAKDHQVKYFLEVGGDDALKELARALPPGSLKLGSISTRRHRSVGSLSIGSLDAAGRELNKRNEPRNKGKDMQRDESRKGRSRGADEGTLRRQRDTEDRLDPIVKKIKSLQANVDAYEALDPKTRPVGRSPISKELRFQGHNHKPTTTRPHRKDETKSQISSTDPRDGGPAQRSDIESSNNSKPSNDQESFNQLIRQATYDLEDAGDPEMLELLSIRRRDLAQLDRETKKAWKATTESDREEREDIVWNYFVRRSQLDAEHRKRVKELLGW